MLCDSRPLRGSVAFTNAVPLPTASIRPRSPATFGAATIAGAVELNTTFSVTLSRSAGGSNCSKASTCHERPARLGPQSYRGAFGCFR